MNTKTAILTAIVLILLVAIGAGTYLVMNRQVFFSQAQQSTSTSSSGSSCPAPGTPATVTLSYPLCEAGQSGENCQFDKAGCTWESVSGATSYNVKVTEVETGVTIKTETVTGIKTSFPVVQGRTYKCEVSAINACGSTGGTNSDSLLCEVEGIFSPVPVSTPTSPTSAIAPPPQIPVSTPSPIACGALGCSETVPCQTGFICVKTSVGQNYCTKSEYQSHCFRAPGEPSCCQPPSIPKPTLPPAGVLDTTLIIGGAGIGLVILGAAALLLL